MTNRAATVRERFSPPQRPASLRARLGNSSLRARLGNSSLRARLGNSFLKHPLTVLLRECFIMSADRRHARILAMQTLCQWDVQPENAPPIPDDLSEDATIAPRTRTEAGKMVQAFFVEREQVDQRISDASHQWDLTRLSPVERNIMRVAVTEWLTSNVPQKVSLNEAIEIGREYGGKESPGFINGVLDQVLKTLNDKGPTT